MSQAKKLSVAIITFNEEINLHRTLSSISDIADEIIIIDSHSTDSTCSIAAEFTDKIYIEDWKGYTAQKNIALSKCSGDWFLCLDADEEVSSELKSSIQQVLHNPTADAYYINRMTFYNNKLLRYAWRPDWKLRLVNKSSNPIWQGLDIHEGLKITGTTKKLKGDLIHYSYKDIKQHFLKTMDYARLSAQSYYSGNIKFSLIKLIFNPIYAFFRLFILNRGFMDGIHGFVAAVSSFCGTFLKYTFLWEIEYKNRRTSPRPSPKEREVNQ